MAKKRTKKEKRQTSARRKNPQALTSSGYSLSDELLEVDSKSRRKKKISQEISFGYDPKVIVADLQKTFMLSLLVFGILAATYAAAQSGYLSILGY